MKLRTQRTLSFGAWVAAIAAYVVVVRIMMFPNSKGEAIASNEMIALQRVGTALLISLLPLSAWVYYTFLVAGRFSETIKGIGLSATTFGMVLIGAECYFLNNEESNAIGERWSYKLWDRKYIPHRTSFYYTDAQGQPQRADLRQPLPRAKTKLKPIWFIGDSFTFGFGIENTEQTFPALVQHLFTSPVLAINLGDGGASTYKEAATLMAYDTAALQPPAAVVWQYFGNDIDINDEGPDLYEKQLLANPWVQWGQRMFKAKSFLLDFIYWHYFTGNEQGAFIAYTRFLQQLYHTSAQGLTVDTALANTPYRQHLVPLKKAAAYYRQRQVPFVVVIFPFLWQQGPENAETLYTQRLAADLASDSIAAIDLTPLIKPIDLPKRMANLHDPHPSPLVAKLTADTLAQYFKTHYYWQ